MKLTISVLLIASVLAACAPTVVTKNEVRPTPSLVRQELTLTPRQVEERMAYLDQVIASNSISEKKRETASTLKQHYHVLLSILKSSPGEREEREALRNFVAGLEVELGAILTEKEPAKPDCASLFKEFSSAGRELIGLYMKGDLETAVSRCASLRERFGQEAFTTEMTSVCALSLARLGKKEEALALAEPLARRIKEQEYVYKIGDLIPGWRGESEAEAARSLEKSNLASLFKRIEGLVNTGEFDEAEDILSKGREDFKEESSRYEIDKALEALKEKRERFVEERIEAVSRRNDIIREARDLIARERPEEALAKLKAMEQQAGSADPDLQAATKDAVEEIIARERNRAARFFLQARDASDPAAKEQLLLLARGILKAVVERYPDSPSVRKAGENLQAVEREISSLKKPSAGKNP